MKFKVKAVMIDLDGTLIHTAPEIARAANAMLAGLGRPTLDAKLIENYIGEGAMVLIKRCLTGKLDGEPSTDLLAQAQKLFFDFYVKIVAESQPYALVEEALQAVKQTGVQMACITNKPAAFTMPLLEKSGLLPYFDLVVAGDTLQKKKPEPDQIFYVCEKFNVFVNESLLIGDSKTDIAAARNAGCFIFGVPYGYNQGYSIEIGTVDALINHLHEAVDLITTEY
jgi:phosphoglycolate phosphatase